jgi:hypothetical protein
MRILIERIEKRYSKAALKQMVVPQPYTSSDVNTMKAAYKQAATGAMAKADLDVTQNSSIVQLKASMPATYHGDKGTLVLMVYRHRVDVQVSLGVAGVFVPKGGGAQADVLPERTVPGGEDETWPVDPQEFGEEAAKVSVRRLREMEKKGIVVS